MSEQIRSFQGKTNFLDPDHVDVQSASSESTDVSSMDMNYPSTSNPSMDKNFLLMKENLKQEKKLAKLNKKYGSLDNFVKQKKQVFEKAKSINEQVNVGYLS